MNTASRFSLLVPVLAPVVGFAQEAPLPPIPPFHRETGPNPAFGTELRASVASLQPEQKKPFFKVLRKRERDLSQLILNAEQTLKDAKALHKRLMGQEAPTVAKARGVVTSEEERLVAYRAMAKEIQKVRRESDPQRVDAGELRVDLYGGFQFSSLYRDPGENASFFSKSRPFASLDIRQAYHRPDRDTHLETFSTLSFQSSSYEQSETVNIITTSGQFRAEAGVWWMKDFTENVSWGVVASLGLVGFNQQDTSQGLASGSRDQFRNRMRLGLTLRQESGALKGSFAEWSYLRDPLFAEQNRLFVRGRVVLTQFGSEGASGDFYMEGSVNKGSEGRDESVLLVGIRLNTLSFLRSLGGGARN
jgi:hypothetical protein